jgi:hypothetical protein
MQFIVKGYGTNRTMSISCVLSVFQPKLTVREVLRTGVLECSSAAMLSPHFKIDFSPVSACNLMQMAV